MSTAFLITARLKSTRLPKKIILEVMGKPLISHMIDRIKFAKKINKIIICTSTNSQDDLLEKIAVDQNINCFRGSEDDVLQRLLDASNKFNLKYFANITADIPMIDPSSIDYGINEYHNVKADLVLPPDYNLCGSNIVKVSTLSKICQQKQKKDTETWLKFFQNHAGIKIHFLDSNKVITNEFIKTSLDYPEDYIFIKKIFDELYDPKKPFSAKDINDLIKSKPEIAKINSNYIHLKRWDNHRGVGRKFH